MQTASVNTPAIISPTSATSAATGKAAETDTASTPFGAVLSKEVAERGNASEAASVPSAAKPGKAQAAPGGTEPGEQSEAAATTDDTATAADTAQTQAATPADMLALMASMNPARNALPAVKTAASDAAAGSGDVSGMAADARIAALQQAAAGTAAAHIQTGGLAQQSGKPDALSKHADLAHLTAGQRAGNHPAVDAKDGAEERPAAAGKDLKAAPAEDLRAKTADVSKGTEDSLGKLAHKQTFGTEFKEAVASAQAAAVQQAAPVNATQAASAAAHISEHIAPRVGTPGWDQAVAQKVTWMVAGDQQSASLTLNPPDLGPLQVVLNVTNSHADAAFTAAQPEVRQALEAAMPRLREMLSDAGIQLGQATVGSGAPNQQGTPEQRQFQPAARGDSGDAAVDTQPRTTRVPSLSAGSGLVDTFA